MATENKKLILVIDDEECIRDLLVSVLQNEGYRILEAGNGQEALEIVRKGFEIDAQIVDLAMPVLDGLSYLKELEAEGIDIPSVVVTGALDTEGLFFINKPFNLKDLLGAVKKAIGD